MSNDEIKATMGGRSLWQHAGERLRRNKAATVSLWLLTFFIVIVVAGPWVVPHDYTQTNLSLGSTGPSLASGHWFGTDPLGRDVLARTLAGGRISLLVGLVATLVSLVIGVFWGAVAGYYGGRTDALMMRFVDSLYAMPFMFFVILLMVVFGRNIVLIFVAIGAINWLDMARIVRGQTISLRQREFVQAATLMGAGPLAIVIRHIIPNLLGVVVVYVTLTIPQVMLVESFLSYLGLGVQEPSTSWGALVNQGALEMETAPWLLVFPALFLAGTLFCFNFVGDGLRDAFDPKSDEDGW